MEGVPRGGGKRQEQKERGNDLREDSQGQVGRGKDMCEEVRVSEKRLR